MNIKNSFLYKITIIALFVTTISMQAMLPRFFGSRFKKPALLRAYRSQPARAYTSQAPIMEQHESPSWRGFLWDWIGRWTGKNEAKTIETSRLQAEKMQRVERNLEQAEMTELDKDIKRREAKLAAKQKTREIEDRVKGYIRK